jgi:hypothetical protein
MSKVDKKYKLNRILFDILLIATSFVVTYCITGAEFQFAQFISFTILLSIIWLIASYFSSIYGDRRSKKFSEELTYIFYTFFLYIILLSSLSFFINLFFKNPIVFFYSYIIILLPSLIIQKYIFRKYIHAQIFKGDLYESVIIVGLTYSGLDYLETINKFYYYGYRCVGYIDDVSSEKTIATYLGNIEKTSSILLDKNSFGKTYINLEPRITGNYRINDLSSIKLAYARNVQHLHLLSNATASSPSDQWIGDSYNITPELADQVSVGYSRNFKNNTYELGTELYYKGMQNQLDYKDGTNINTIADVESALLYGIGRAYGFELLAKKKMGVLSGWISYTLSKTERKIAGINGGNWYNAKQDRTHDISIVTILELNSKWSVSGVFVYNTGNAVTFPTGKYSLGGQTIYQYANRNANRMPTYHRLDLSVTYENLNRKKHESSWNFSLYNVYGRENAYRISFQDDPLDSSKTQIIQTALFRWVPSITYNFKF